MQLILCIATNPQMFFDVELDVPEPERLATVELIKEDIARFMDAYQYLPANIAETVNKLEEANRDDVTEQDLLDMGFQKEG
jgi:heme oxygenase